MAGMNLDDWERAEGSPCSRCGDHDLLIQDGLCRACYSLKCEADAVKAERKALRRALLKGTVSISELKGVGK